MFPLDIQIGWFLLPAIFWPAVVFPGVLFTLMFLWPYLDAAVKRDNRFHNLLTWPSERPGRVAWRRHRRDARRAAGGRRQ